MSDDRSVPEFEWVARNSDVALIQNTPEETSSGGIILPASKDPPRIGRILSVGPDVKDLKPGQTVIYGNFSGAEVEVQHQGRKVTMVDQRNCKLARKDGT